MGILLGVTKFLGWQGLAFRGHGKEKDGNFRQTVNLLARHCLLLKDWLENIRLRPYHVSYLSAQSQNEFIEIVGKEVREHMIDEIKKTRMYSIMADMMPDVFHKD